MTGISRAAALSLATGVLAATLFGGSCAHRVASEDPPPEADDAEETDPLGVNAACYVCHIPFVKEELSKTHLEAEVTCVRCHGLSAGHANDEDIGATPPDIVYSRDRVNAFCRTCHERHDAPPERVVEVWLARRPPEGAPVCTDCHGSHRIEATAGES